MASTLTVKDMNQEIVRDCMKGLGPVSKSVLSRKTGLSLSLIHIWMTTESEEMMKMFFYQTFHFNALMITGLFHGI